MDETMLGVINEAKRQGIEKSFLNHFYTITSFAVKEDEDHAIKSNTIRNHARFAYEMAMKQK